MNDYKILIELLEKYKEEATSIFNKLKEANREARTGILQYGRYSVFGRIEWDCFNENYITVRYNDDYDDDYGDYSEYVSSTLTIPADILFDDAKIDKWIKSEIDKTIEENERREYERLKEKFEK